MKKKLLALVLGLVLLCGLAAGVASAKPWENWQLKSTFALGHEDEETRAQWLCTKIGNGFLKLFSVKGFESEKEAKKFVENCFSDDESKLLVPVNDDEDMYGFDEDTAKAFFKDELVHPYIYFNSNEINKLRITNVYGAHRFGVSKENVEDNSKSRVRFSIDPWIGWARPGDTVSISLIDSIDDGTGTLGVWIFLGTGDSKVGPGGAKSLDGSDATHDLKVKMGTADFVVSPGYHNYH